MLIQEIRSAASARILELKQEIEALRTPGDLTAARIAEALKKPGIFGEKFHMPTELCHLVGEYAAMTKNEKRDQLKKAEREHHNLEVLYNDTSLPPAWWGVGQATCSCATGLLIARGGAWGASSSWSTPLWCLGSYVCGSVALSGCLSACVSWPLMLTMERNKVKKRCEALEQHVLGVEDYPEDPIFSRENSANRQFATQFAGIAKDLLKKRRESQTRNPNEFIIEIDPSSEATSLLAPPLQAQDELKLD